jgi:hypothetical protein
MSDKQQTAVEWIGDNIQFDMTFVDVFGLIRQAKEMESKKQQKYDEMLAMLEELKEIFDKYSVDFESEFFKYKQPLEQLIKEAKEL